MKPRIGTTLVSVTDATSVIVIRWGDEDVDVSCGGAPMVEAANASSAARTEPDPAWSDCTQLGKRYADETLGIEVLCTKAGQGTLAVGVSPLLPKSAKPLPASD